MPWPPVCWEDSAVLMSSCSSVLSVGLLGEDILADFICAIRQQWDTSYTYHAGTACKEPIASCVCFVSTMLDEYRIACYSTTCHFSALHGEILCLETVALEPSQ